VRESVARGLSVARRWETSDRITSWHSSTMPWAFPSPAGLSFMPQTGSFCVRWRSGAPRPDPRGSRARVCRGGVLSSGKARASARRYTEAHERGWSDLLTPSTDCTCAATLGLPETTMGRILRVNGLVAAMGTADRSRCARVDGGARVARRRRPRERSLPLLPDDERHRLAHLLRVAVRGRGEWRARCPGARLLRDDAAGGASERRGGAVPRGVHVPSCCDASVLRRDILSRAPCS
jgi:hypothetical protein